MKRGIIIVTLFLLGGAYMKLSAQVVSRAYAEKKAQAFFNSCDAESSNNGLMRSKRKAPRLDLVDEHNEYFIFNDEENGGYVIVSGDERMPDILGFSYDGHIDIDAMPCNMSAWLDEYSKQIEYLQTHPGSAPERREATSRVQINPLISSTWNQYAPYNNKCPLIGSVRALTGCVATAMAQIMNYHQWPEKTTSAIPGYTTTTNKLNISSTPVTTIDWDNMLNNYRSNSYTTSQGNAVATLMKLCAVAAHMDYGAKESGAYTEEYKSSLPKYFGYNPDITSIYRDDYTMDYWTQLMYDELYDGRPILYSGYGSPSGHAFVIDGYKLGDYFHVNWGWGGLSDGYFYITSLKDYNYNQEMVIGIQPLSEDNEQAYAVLNGETLTFYFDDKQNTRSGTVFPFGWSS